MNVSSKKCNFIIHFWYYLADGKSSSRNWTSFQDCKNLKWNIASLSAMWKNTNNGTIRNKIKNTYNTTRCDSNQNGCQIPIFQYQTHQRTFSFGGNLNKRINKNSPTEEIMTLMQHILTLSNLNFNGRYFIQTKGCTMDTVTALHTQPSTWTNLKTSTWKLRMTSSFTQDIFIIYTSREAKLNNFLTNLNMLHDSIKFDHKKFTHSFAFLDT